MILFWFYFSGLSNRIIRKKYLVTGDWGQSKQITEVGSHKYSGICFTNDCPHGTWHDRIDYMKENASTEV